MNDRMTELYAKACLDARDIHPTDVPAFISCMAEKFAELILQECFQACMNEGASYEEKAAGAYQSNLYVTAIKKHFGVEE